MYDIVISDNPIYGSFPGFVDKENEAWIDAPSVCRYLGYVRDTSDVVKKLDDDEKRLVNWSEVVVKSGPTDTAGLQMTFQKPYFPRWFVNEPGFYALVYRSEKPEAKAFSKWVRKEVLPSIRKTGGYGVCNSEYGSFLDGVEKVAISTVKLLEANHKLLKKANNISKTMKGGLIGQLDLVRARYEGNVEEVYKSLPRSPEVERLHDELKIPRSRNYYKSLCASGMMMDWRCRDLLYEELEDTPDFRLRTEMAKSIARKLYGKETGVSTISRFIGIFCKEFPDKIEQKRKSKGYVCRKVSNVGMDVRSSNLH